MSDSLNDDHLKFAARLKQARQLAGLSQGQAAQLLGLHRPSLSQIESGQRKVSAEELNKLCDIYDTSPDYLLGRTPDTLTVDDPRVKFAARELEKLKPEALDSLLKMIASFQEPSKETKTRDDDK